MSWLAIRLGTVLGGGFLMAAVAALPACSQGDTEMMSRYREAFDEHANAYQSELDGHQAAVVATPELGNIAVLEVQHASRLQGHMTGMRDQLGDMTMCMGSAAGTLGVDAVNADLDRLQQECDSHQQAMAAAVDLAGAGVEERRHHDGMAGMLSAMREDMSTMMDGSGRFTCMHH